MSAKAFQPINKNSRGAESNAWLLYTQFGVRGLTITLQANLLLTRTSLSSYFRRLDALHWTPYMDECIAVLAENEEYPSDILLVYLVKLHLIFEKAGRGQWYEEQDDAMASARAPPIFYLKALQAQLQDFKAKIPPAIQRNGMSAHQSIPPLAYQNHCRCPAPATLHHRIQSARDITFKIICCCQ